MRLVHDQGEAKPVVVALNGEDGPSDAECGEEPLGVRIRLDGRDRLHHAPDSSRSISTGTIPRPVSSSTTARCKGAASTQAVSRIG